MQTGDILLTGEQTGSETTKQGVKFFTKSQQVRVLLYPTKDKQPNILPY